MTKAGCGEANNRTTAYASSCSCNGNSGHEALVGRKDRDKPMRKSKHNIPVRFVPAGEDLDINECLALAEMAEELGNLEAREFWLNQSIRQERIHAPVPGLEVEA